MADDREPGGEELLLASRLWPAAAVLIPLSALALLVSAGIWLMPNFPFVPVGLLLATVVVAWSQRGDALLADETGLLVRHRGRVTPRYRWEEIREAGLTRPGFGQVALAVYPNGGPWDVPGPNSAVLVGRIWMLVLPRSRFRSGHPGSAAPVLDRLKVAHHVPSDGRTRLRHRPRSPEAAA